MRGIEAKKFGERREQTLFGRKANIRWHPPLCHEAFRCRTGYICSLESNGCLSQEDICIFSPRRILYVLQDTYVELMKLLLYSAVEEGTDLEDRSCSWKSVEKERVRMSVRWETEGLQTVGIVCLVFMFLKLMHLLGLIDITETGERGNSIFIWHA